jgi:Nucleotidyltransferase domain
VSSYDHLSELVNELAGSREDILGLVLSGSRARGTATDDSDWDCYVILVEGSNIDAEVSALMDPSLDVCVMPLPAFRTYARPGTDHAWDAYACPVDVVVDRLGGEIGAIAAGKEYLPDDTAQAITRDALDAYINAAVRSAKSLRGGRTTSASLDAAEGIGPAVKTLFGIGGRVGPYNRYLGWELVQHPLDADPLPLDLERLLGDVLSADASAAAGLFAIVEARARDHGFGAVVDAWDAKALDAVRNPS